MQSRLVVKNFGPIEFVDLNLRNVNVFIGPQASGKSALAKIYTICKAPRKFISQTDNDEISNPSDVQSFLQILADYNISSFLRDDTEIIFDSELHYLSYQNSSLSYKPKLLNKIRHLHKLGQSYTENLDVIKKDILDLGSQFLIFKIRLESSLKEKGEKIDFLDISKLNRFKDLEEDQFSKIISIIEDIENELSTNTALYIPAERNFINIIKNASMNLLLHNVPIPKHILSFGAEVEKATIKDIDLGFLQGHLRYRNINGEDKIFTDDDNSIKLTEAASGIQSIVPVLLPILSFRRYPGHRSFVIEEPELNLFPLAQYEVVKLLESERAEAYWEDYGTIHTYTTHSPYILSGINNLLYADKVRVKINMKPEMIRPTLMNELNKIIPNPISPYYFTAYQISNGKAESIFNSQTGLIENNFIDMSSDKIADDFDSLMNLIP